MPNVNRMIRDKISNVQDILGEVHYSEATSVLET